MEAHVSGRHRDTVENLFGHPAGGNVEWRQVLSLLESIGTVTEEHNGKFKVTVGAETEVLTPPHGKEIEAEMVPDLRRMLTNAGFGPGGEPASPDQLVRDHGDGRWGDPTA
jgi:hypothetical protein